MTRKEHLKFCKFCTNRKLDLKVGLLCGLTEKIADFDNECPSYNEDSNAINQIDNEDVLNVDDVKEKLSNENISKFKEEQNLTRGIIASIVIGIGTAILWGIITVVTGFQIGYMAIAIGAAVGIAMRYAGKGLDKIFGYCGVLIAILSCLLGNFLSIIGYIANAENLGYIETLFYFDYSQLFYVLSLTFKPIDLLFYSIAGVEAYKFSFRAFTEKDIYEIEK